MRGTATRAARRVVDDDAGWRYLMEPIRRKLTERSLIPIRIFLLSLILYAATVARIYASESSSWILELSTISIPYCLVYVSAALSPTRMPPSSAGFVAFCFIVLAAADGAQAFAWWSHTELLWDIRVLRSSLAAFWSVGSVQVAWKTLRSRGADFWRAVRLWMTVATAVRLLVVGIFYFVHGTPSGIFPPARLDFPTSLGFNLCCFATSTVFLTPLCRTVLSQVTGGARVVVTLSEYAPLASLPDNEPDRLSTIGSAALSETRSIRSNAYSVSSAGRSNASGRRRNRSGSPTARLTAPHPSQSPPGGSKAKSKPKGRSRARREKKA